MISATNQLIEFTQEGGARRSRSRGGSRRNRQQGGRTVKKAKGKKAKGKKAKGKTAKRSRRGGRN
jgi:hypothetical protein|tara:strand:+ start:1879 stop:2073 length:195 start_codon:yes stop_codon:yes gene_type:complete